MEAACRAYLRKEAKLMNTSARGCALTASCTLPCTGMATSSRPKNTFWKPPGLPGCTTHATDGTVRPASGPTRISQLRHFTALAHIVMCADGYIPSSL